METGTGNQKGISIQGGDLLLPVRIYCQFGLFLFIGSVSLQTYSVLTHLASGPHPHSKCPSSPGEGGC